MSYWSRERCPKCYGTCFIYDYYNYDKNGQPKQKTCPRCEGKGCVEIRVEE